MILRPYQLDAVAACYSALRESDGNPCIVIPTGGGKTPVISQICSDAVNLWNGRVVVLAHVKELLEQAAEKIQAMSPGLPVGVYSAGLGSKDLGYAVTIAGIQSIYQKANALGRVDLVIIDECFIAGTMVETPTGDIPIEQVCPGTMVRNGIGVGEVVAISARPASALVQVEFDDGTHFKCTANHPVFTEQGWVAAGALEIGSMAFGHEDLSLLRQRVSAVEQDASRREAASDEGAGLEEAKVLLDLMLKDPRELHAVARDSAEGLGCPDSGGAFATTKMRQRRTDQSADETAIGTGRRVGSRVHRADSELQNALHAEVSEDRHFASGGHDCRRVRWTKPSDSDPKRARLPQDDLPCSKRVVRVSADEQAGDRIVFNLQVSGHPSYFANGVLVHNCHLIPHDGEGMYRSFLADLKAANPTARVIGLTATPYRMKSGEICGPGHILSDVCYEIGVSDLIARGYLCPLRSKAGDKRVSPTNLHVRAGEYVAAEAEALMDDGELVQAACSEIVSFGAFRQACLIFCAGVDHGRHVAATIESLGHECGFVDGETPANERAILLDRFRSGNLKYLANVNVLTTGFDAPNIDLIALLRPTLSPGLFYQMCGRGFRTCEGKADCIVLDFAGNVLRHGPVDAIRARRPGAPGSGEAPAKECPQCLALIAAAFKSCPECEFVFPLPKKQTHAATAADGGVLSGQVTRTEYEVLDTSYYVHTKRGDESAPLTMRVEYRIGFNWWAKEWVCFDHEGYARDKAEAWWKQRSNLPVPESTEQAVRMANADALAEPWQITVEKKAGEKFERIVEWQLGEKPKTDNDWNEDPYYRASQDGGYDVLESDDIPF